MCLVWKYTQRCAGLLCWAVIGCSMEGFSDWLWTFRVMSKHSCELKYSSIRAFLNVIIYSVWFWLLSLLGRWTQPVIKLRPSVSVFVSSPFCSSSNTEGSFTPLPTEHKGQHGRLFSEVYLHSDAPVSSSLARVESLLKCEHDSPPPAFVLPPCKRNRKRRRSSACRNSAAPNPHGKPEVVGLMAYWQAARWECVCDQEAPTWSNGRCDKGDRRGGQQEQQHLEKCQEGGVALATEPSKEPNSRRAVIRWFLLSPEIDPAWESAI